MSAKIFTINSRKYDGGTRRSWECELVSTGNEFIDLIGTFAETVEHPDLGTIEKGTISRERFYFDRWYNYFVFESPAGVLRNKYINICMPPVVTERVIDYVDLDIDIIVWPDGRIETLDVEEFNANSDRYGYPESVRNKALETLDAIQADPHSIFEDV